MASTPRQSRSKSASAEAAPGAWRLFGDAELWVDPAVWEDVVERGGGAIRDLHAAAQTPRAPGTTHVSATAMLLTVDAPAVEGEKR